MTKFADPTVTNVKRKAGTVVLLTYRGDSAPDPVTGKVVRNAFERYAFYRQGHEVDLTLVRSGERRQRGLVAPRQ
ncbi:hypothetical protein ACH4PW_08860 [Streptomyces sp. NPDC017082]|uniref:hypothetical protein n=1 Tax=Streptomyces sp. NPDC017082 TaxID=3364974 RepID=UPI0037AF8369